MITDDDVMRLFEQADPARTTDDLNDTLDATGYLDALRTRSNNVTDIDTTETSTEHPDHRRWYVVGAAVAAVAILIVGGLVLLNRDETDEPEVPATVPPTVAPTTTAAPPVEDAVGRATAFLASFEQRELASVEAQLADGFTMQSAFPGESFGEPSTGSSNEWMDLRYQVATATRYVDPVCSVAEQGTTETVVECVAAMQLLVHQVSNDEGVPTTLGITLNDDGVVGMTSRHGENFGRDLRPFDDWVEANRPAAVEPVEEPQNFAELVQNAEAEAQLAAEWVAFAVDAVEAATADFNAGELDAYLARYEPGTEISGFDPAVGRDAIAALMAGGNRDELSNCGPNGVLPAALVIVCDVLVRPGHYDVSGVEANLVSNLEVAADGTITEGTSSGDFEVMLAFDVAFEQWLAGAHPDVHGQVEWVDTGFSPLAAAEDQPLIAQYFEEFVAQSDVYPLDG